jgi:NAD(P)-dependent dehydrogenase (short-subunit alcohol dehydrogenase family)
VSSRVFITGACGFIGRALAARLRERGAEVRGVGEQHPVRTNGNPYVDTKVASEQVALQAHAAGEVPVTEWLRKERLI